VDVKRWIAGAVALGASPAAAQSVEIEPIVDARVRYETVDHKGVPLDAHALTARVRSGLRLTRGRWSALGESEATLAIVGDYFDGVRGDARRATVADPQNIQLNRIQLSYAIPKQGSVTVGRQRIDLADQRFVASAPFRQNDQTIDAVRVQWTGVPNLTADVTYAWDVHTINGAWGRGARPGSVPGDNVFALLGYRTPIGTLTAFAYVVDQDLAALQSYRLSSRTLGARFVGSQPLGGGWALGYNASWARQNDHHRNPNDYTADYWLAEGSIGRKAVTATAGYEVLGASDGRALTSFQTPLAAVFKFQGWADRFTTTPPDGVRDLYVSATGGWKPGGAVSAITLTAAAHRFTSDRAIRHYGDELDLLAAVKLGRTTLSARHAWYEADTFSTDTRKFWLTAEWAF
jgi:hypothetical protein